MNLETNIEELNRLIFRESPDKTDFNRELARQVEIRPAFMVDGTTGVRIRLGKQIAIFNKDEACDFMQQIITALYVAEKTHP